MTDPPSLHFCDSCQVWVDDHARADGLPHSLDYHVDHLTYLFGAAYVLTDPPRVVWQP